MQAGCAPASDLTTYDPGGVEDPTLGQLGTRAAGALFQDKHS